MIYDVPDALIYDVYSRYLKRIQVIYFNWFIINLLEK